MSAIRLKIAIQKKGRLNSDSIQLLERCGVQFRLSGDALITRAKNLPIDILLVRDDDIPTLVMSGVCDCGIVGENVLFEKQLHEKNTTRAYAISALEDDDETAITNPVNTTYQLITKLGFGRCRLSIAAPNEKVITSPKDLANLRIATSYPYLLEQYLQTNNIPAKILTISGSVEIAPRLGMSDVICDLVSTGRTLEEHQLKEVAVVVNSQAVLIQSPNALHSEKQAVLSLLVQRIKGVLKAQESKYIMFHAPKSALERIKTILPGFETPTIMPLTGVEDKVAVHVVSKEAVFWDTLEKLKQNGASSILVLPIEKMLK